MRKVIFSLIFSLCVLVSNTVYGSTKTYERTLENLGISNDIELTDTVINAALKTPKVDARERIYDFADLFTDSEELLLYRDVLIYIEKYKMDMVIVTIDDNNKTSAMAYADDFYDYNDFGTDSEHSGILFLIDMDTREMWISTTGKAINVYTDSRIDNILDECYYEISEEEYYDCAKDFIYKASYYGEKGIPVGSKGDIELVPSILAAAFFSFIFALIFILVNKSKHTTIHKATQAKQYLVSGSFKLTDKRDVFVSTHTNKFYDPPSSSSSGGSSTHISSSGRSHGGGGRSF